MNWALVGASTIAAEFMNQALRQGGQSTIGWLVSGAGNHAEAYAATESIARVTPDMAMMLLDDAVGAVYISSTNEKHVGQAMACIAAGKHVICEKPLAMTVDDARTMDKAATAAGVVLATNHHLRCAGSHRAVRDLIEAGRIGTVLSVRVHHAVQLPPHLQGWRINDAAAGGGVIADITMHDADCVRFLLNEDPVSVVAEAAATGLGHGVEDTVMSVWAMPSGAMVMAHESFTHPHAGSGIEVHGTEGSIFAHGVMTQRPVGTVDLVTAAGRLAIPFAAHNLCDEAVRMFLDAVAGKGRPAATGHDGVASLAVALAVRTAAQTGQRVMVDGGGMR